MKITRRQLRKLINEVYTGTSGNRTEFSPDECAIALAAAQEYREFAKEFERVTRGSSSNPSLDQKGLNLKEKLIDCVLDNKSFLAKDQTEGETTFMNLVLDDELISGNREKIVRQGRDIARFGSEPQSGKSL